MRPKLHTFQAFADTLLPLEIDYLLGIHRFEDPERVAILHQLAEHVRQPVVFSAHIDKRKYSHVKKWIQEHLDAADVDRQFAWLSRMETAVYTDSIDAASEKQLLKCFEQAGPDWFHFQKLYLLARSMRHYLLIRMRTESVQAVEHFLDKNREAFGRAEAVSEELYRLTKCLSDPHAASGEYSWSTWLEQVFYDETLDGHNRILAFVRLIFFAYSQRQYALLPDKLDYMERAFAAGRLYARRILTNYYSQRLLYHAHKQEFEQAAAYGYLSLRNANADRLYYANNLAGVLLRLRRGEDALQVLRSAAPDAKRSTAFHNKIGHAAYLIGAFNLLGKYQQAETHAEVLLRAYRKEMLEHRRHLFFANYWEALLCGRKAARLLKSNHTAQVLERDSVRASNPNYLPTLPWLWTLAAYQEGKLGRAESAETVRAFLGRFADQPLPAAIQHLQELTLRLAPEVMAH